MSNILEDIERISVTLAALDTGKMDSLYDALATRIAGTGAKDVAEAIESIKATGEDPAKYIPVSRSYLRQQQLEQRLRHAEEQHQLDLRKQIPSIVHDETVAEYEANNARQLAFEELKSKNMPFSPWKRMSEQPMQPPQ